MGGEDRESLGHLSHPAGVWRLIHLCVHRGGVSCVFLSQHLDQQQCPSVTLALTSSCLEALPQTPRWPPASQLSPGHPMQLP